MTIDGGKSSGRDFQTPRKWKTSNVTQYPLTPMSKWRTLVKKKTNFRNWNAGLFGFVYLDPVGQNCGTKFRNLCNLLERNLCGQPLVRIALGASVAFFHPLPSVYAIFWAHCMYCRFSRFLLLLTIFGANRILASHLLGAHCPLSLSRTFAVSVFVARGLIFSCGVLSPEGAIALRENELLRCIRVPLHTQVSACTEMRLSHYGCQDTREETMTKTLQVLCWTDSESGRVCK